jgi:signal transduction histidine kinase
MTSVAAPGPDDRQWLNRTIMRAVSIALLGDFAFVGLSPSLHSPYFWRPGTLIGLGVLALVGVVVVGLTLRGRTDLHVLRLITYTGFVVTLVILAAPKSGAPPSGAPWPLHPTVIAACTAPLCFPRAIAWRWVAALASAYAVLRMELVWWPVAAVDAMTLVVGSLAVASIVDLLRSRYDEAERSHLGAAEAAELARAEVQEEAERAWWDLLIHDKVLGALLMASRSTTPNVLVAARALAVDAIDAAQDAATTRHQPHGGENWVSSLESLADNLGLHAVVAVTGTAAPARVAAALLAAGTEAIVNAAKHAGVGDVLIEGTQGSSDVRVRIADQGRGFDRTRVPPGRMGLSRSIPGHMSSVGGSAAVTSAPGKGTEVLLTWRTPRVKSRPVAVWDPSHAMPFSIVAAAWIAMEVMAGAIQRTSIANGWLEFLGLGMFALGAAFIVTHRGRDLSLIGVVASLGALAVLIEAAVASRYPDGGLWFAGATVPLVVALSLSDRIGHAWSLGGGGFAIVVVMSAARDAWDFGAGYEAGAQLLMFALLGTLVARSLSTATGRVRSATRETARSRSAARASSLRIEEGERRMALLTEVAVPLLRRIASGAVVTAEERASCRRAEAATRDHLVADILVDDSVRTAAAEARERGARVVLHASGPGDKDVSQAQAPTVMAFRRAIALLLVTCGPGSDLTARWHPESSSHAGTIVVGCPALAVDADRLAETLSATARLVEIDDDSVLVELNALAHLVHDPEA